MWVRMEKERKIKRCYRATLCEYFECHTDREQYGGYDNDDKSKKQYFGEKLTTW